ncbi:MAG: hypothetical protein KC468_31135 [Myxococcales bacterium]|nr:hypothetical protein [Myxococcales bacterium]
MENENDTLPGSVTALGLGLFACAFLPLGPGGPSYFEIARDIVMDGGLGALVFVVLVGAPFVLGLAIASNAFVGRSLGRSLVVGTVALFQAELLLYGAIVWDAHELVAARALLGFALVSGLSLIYQSASHDARDTGGPGLRWYTRWGALLVAGLALWIRLQSLQGAPIGLAIDGALLSSVLIIAALRRG